MEKRRVILFAGTFAALLFVFIVRLLLSHGATIGNYYVTHDWGNTSMDFFNPLVFFADPDPYSSSSNYPALCACLFKAFRLLLPEEAPSDAFELRAYMPAQLIYISVLIGCFFVIAYSLFKLTEHLEKGRQVAVCAVVAFSGPMLFALERGNTILIAFAMTLFFIAEYKSQSARMRLIAYCALAGAAGLKVYPCVFALLVLRNGRREFLVACCLSVLALALPFFAFDGIESMRKMIVGISASSDEQISRGLGHQYSVTFLIRDIAALAGYRIVDVPFVWQIVAMGFCLLLFAVARKEWAKIFALSLACVWVPGFAATYSLLFLAIPAVVFVCEKDSVQRTRFHIEEAICSISFAFIVAPQSLPRITIERVLDAWPNALSPLTGGELVIQLAIMLIFLTVLFGGVRGLLTGESSIC